jgi:aarF domain-containing kinase
MVISTNTLNPLPPSHIIPTKDEAWEARELKFHEENVKQINDLVRRMNAQAPAVVRRPLITREAELERIRGDLLKSEVWQEVQRRAEESRLEQRAPAGKHVPFQFLGGDGLSRLGRATRRSVWTIARPVVSVIGKGRVGGADGTQGDKKGQSGEAGPDENRSYRGTGILVVAGVGIGLVTYLRRSVESKSIYDSDIIPIHPPVKTTPNQPSHVVASSPS